MAIAVLATDDATGVNWCKQQDSSTNINTADLRLISSPTSSVRYWIALRFPTTPTDLTATNLRQATLQLTGSNNTGNDINGRVWGHKIGGASAAFANGNGSGNSNIKGRTRTTYYADFVSIDQPAFVTFNFPQQGPNSILEILQEVLAEPGRTAGSALTLIFEPNTDTLYEWRCYTDAEDDYKARLILNYGDPSTNPVELDVYFAGDSTIAYTGHSGFDRGTVTFPLFGSATFAHAAAGMASDNAYEGLTSGDNFRGYCPGGIYQRELLARYGDDLIMFTHEHALAGSLAEQWNGGIGTGQFWGDVSTPGTFRYNLANPQTDNQLVIMNIGPNDLLKYGGGHLLYDESDPTGNDAAWASHVETNVETWVRNIIDEIYATVPNQARCWVFITGYPNHCVIDKIPSPTTGTIFLPNGNSQATFRSIWCIGNGSANQMGFYQYCWDTGIPSNLAQPWTDGLHPGPDAQYEQEWQSAFVQFAIDRQRKANPADCTVFPYYNPSATSWNLLGSGAIFNINAPALGFLSGSTWSYSFGTPSVTTSGWYLGFRNVTDITINGKMALLDEMNSRIAADYDRVVFADCRDKLPVDTTYSADPDSPYAQPPADRFVEGVHLNDTGTTEWITASGSVLDRMVTTIPVLQRFANLFTHWENGVEVPVYLQGEWDGAEVVDAYWSEVA